VQIRRHAEFETSLAPDRVIAALTDFSENRPGIWPGLDPDKYQVFELGDTWAVVKEGNRRPDIWVRERYDWSARGRVSWRPEQSNAFAAGSRIDVEVSAIPGGGSHVVMDGVRIASSPIGYVTVALLAIFWKRFVLSNYKAVFDRLAREEAAGSVR
jgi:hypothetical protein